MAVHINRGVANVIIEKVVEEVAIDGVKDVLSNVGNMTLTKAVKAVTDVNRINATKINVTETAETKASFHASIIVMGDAVLEDDIILGFITVVMDI